MLTPQLTGFRYFIELAFNGAGFHGWQIQPGEETVQETLNHALGLLIHQPVNVVGCGRTDAGVHASHFVAHFDAEQPVADCDALAAKLNRFLKYPIRIDRIVPVPLDFHARFQACSRTYIYLISTGKTPFLNDFCWEYGMPLDLAAMNEAGSLLVGKHDFTSFSKLHTDVKTNVCEVFEAAWNEEKGVLVFRIRADRFLRNMVRAVVGTLVEVGKGKISIGEVQRILDSKDRGNAGMSVPAKGLFLTRVDYDPGIFKIEPKSPFSNWF